MASRSLNAQVYNPFARAPMPAGPWQRGGSIPPPAPSNYSRGGSAPAMPGQAPFQGRFAPYENTNQLRNEGKLLGDIGPAPNSNPNMGGLPSIDPATGMQRDLYPNMGSTDAWHKLNPDAAPAFGVTGTGPHSWDAQPPNSKDFGQQIGTVAADGLPGQPATDEDKQLLNLAPSPTSATVNPFLNQSNPSQGQPNSAPMIPKDAYGGSGTTQAIVGDPQADGKPNPEMVRVVNGKLDVTPLKGGLPPTLPRFAYGSDASPPAPEVDWGPEDQASMDLAGKQSDYADYSHLMNVEAANHSALWSGDPPPVTRPPSRIDPGTGQYFAGQEPGSAPTIVPPSYASAAPPAAPMDPAQSSPSAPPPAPGNAPAGSGMTIGSDVNLFDGQPQAAPTGAQAGPGFAPLPPMRPSGAMPPPAPDQVYQHQPIAPTAVDVPPNNATGRAMKVLPVPPKPPNEHYESPLDIYTIAAAKGQPTAAVPPDSQAWKDWANLTPAQQHEYKNMMRDPSGIKQYGLLKMQEQYGRNKTAIDYQKHVDTEGDKADTLQENARFHDMRANNWNAANKQRADYENEVLNGKDYAAKGKAQGDLDKFNEKERQREDLYNQIQTRFDQANAKGNKDSASLLRMAGQSETLEGMKSTLAAHDKLFPAEKTLTPPTFTTDPVSGRRFAQGDHLQQSGSVPEARMDMTPTQAAGHLATNRTYLSKLDATKDADEIRQIREENEHLRGIAYPTPKAASAPAPTNAVNSALDKLK